ncbi:NAD(P)H-binding protein [Dyadobacter chenwenxiniae]|uniref:NAD(P)H-binding protein n=1 Tax=Dyadobacter chenwenxiniae TaxID=2906456 RepID=A0A9X1PT27_9BACT|nr:NAD(P)H-binding protein [Dyadobacter chenwenxiniae]MCF0065148.1 NAD(P)H-binding protein [Dyadobacter chenwenxiniae]UON84580.1 NAD(P)H-binding protein [Dyadobacter chenwenxiniae]
MKYIITGSLGNISRPVTKNLVAAGHDVTVISSSADKKSEIESLGATPAIGSLTDTEFLKTTFQNAEVAYLMIPSSFSLPDYAGFQLEVADKYLEALKGSNIKHVVLLSSLGAHMRKGAGPIDALGYLEEKLLEIPDLNVNFLRPSYFFSNLFSLAGMIKHAGIAGNNYGDTDEKLVLTHTDHIAEVATEALLNLFTGKSITNIANDERHPSEIAAVLGKAVGKENTPWITFSDEDAYKGMLGAGLNESFAQLYKEMGQAVRSGEMQAEYWKNRPQKLGDYKLEDFAKEFAGAYAGA